MLSKIMGPGKQLTNWVLTLPMGIVQPQQHALKFSALQQQQEL